jgi:hypothetical protein
MSREEKLAYQRGYQAGLRGRWPAHKPPAPPNEIVASLLLALREIRDHLDAELAAISDPEWEAAFGPIIDKADEAAEAVTEWLKQ